VAALGSKKRPTDGGDGVGGSGAQRKLQLVRFNVDVGLVPVGTAALHCSKTLQHHSLDRATT
jgi:hypothetical protein